MSVIVGKSVKYLIFGHEYLGLINHREHREALEDHRNLPATRKTIMVVTFASIATIVTLRPSRPLKLCDPRYASLSGLVQLCLFSSLRS
jgi:hypothetical protein